MPADPVSPTNKRQRLDIDPNAPPMEDNTFIADADAGESGADDDEDEEKPKTDKKAGRRKIKIEFIQDKSRRHITFSKRKAGIMKKAYELSTLTGTQVLLLVVSETGLVYTFTTAKLQPLVTQPEGKNLIQACLNAPHGQLPSSLPVGTPIGRSSNPMNMPGHGGQAANVPGGLSISGNGKEEEEGEQGDGETSTSATRAPETPTNDAPSSNRKRRRASSTAGAANSRQAAAAANNAAPPTATASSPISPAAPAPQQAGPTSPHNRAQMPLPIPQQGGNVAMSPTQPLASPLDPRQAPPPSPNYTHGPAPSYGGDMYAAGQPGQPGYPPPGGAYYATGHDNAAAQAGAMGGPAWGPPPGVQQQQQQQYNNRR